MHKKKIMPILLIWALLATVGYSTTLCPPDLSDADAEDTPIVLAEIQLKNLDKDKSKTASKNTTDPAANHVVQEKPEITHQWVMRTKKVRECRRVIKILRKPERVCGWEKQDQCTKVPHRVRKYRFKCDGDNYCHKEAYYVTTYEEKCKTIRKRVCKNWFETKRVPQRLCVDKIHRLKCLKEESCTNHKTCLKWVNKETDQGFKYRQCLRWIQFRKCGISYSKCELIHEAPDSSEVESQTEESDEEAQHEHVVTHTGKL